MNSGAVNNFLAATLGKQWLKTDRHGGRQSCWSSGSESCLLDILQEPCLPRAEKQEKAKGCFPVLLSLSGKEANRGCPLLTCPSPHGPD